MTRKLKLNQYASRFVDQHGRERFRFRPTDYSKYLPHPSLPEYPRGYQAALYSDQSSIASKPSIPRSIEDLIRRYYRSLAWQQLSESRQKYLGSSSKGFMSFIDIIMFISSGFITLRQSSWSSRSPTLSTGGGAEGRTQRGA
jgi:hypothetical protein